MTAAWKTENSLIFKGNFFTVGNKKFSVPVVSARGMKETRDSMSHILHAVRYKENLAFPRIAEWIYQVRVWSSHDSE